jgi:Hypothetical protein (DUF2513)
MGLNPDCTRDILLYIEANTNFEINSIDVNDITEELSNYDSKTLYYHIQMIEESELVDNVVWAENRPWEISNLSYNGHQFLSNIHNDKVWKKVKNYINKLPSVSLQVLISIAPTLLEKTLFKP